jgi:hypothetical protein
MWFYTWQDCDMIYATRNKETYCAQPFVSCDAFPESQGLHEKLGEMAAAYASFQSNSEAWQTEYARGHCKLKTWVHDTALPPMVQPTTSACCVLLIASWGVRSRVCRLAC